MVASVDTKGDVRVYAFPCIKKGAGHVVGKGHCARLTNVRFNLTDETVFSTGAEDRSIFQWKVKQTSGATEST
jgi:microtubule-associated protein-like 6